MAIRALSPALAPLAPLAALAALAALGTGSVACTPSPRPVQGVQMGHFVAPSAIEKVKVCQTRESEVVSWFGEPNGRGMESGFTTMRWMGVLGASDGENAMMKSQTIQVWIDPSGRVAGMVVNPTTMPQIPKPCGKAGPAHPTPVPGTTA
jgi:outer membrane protein assembly factor BamE (lipoprotein component of BamABCDE complex)